HAHRRHRRHRQLRDDESSHRSLPTGDLAARLPDVRANRHRPAGWRVADHQRRAWRGQPRADGLGRSGGPARRRPERRLANFTVGAQTPAFTNAALRTVASNWRVSGILNARSGPWMTITSGRDNAFNGMAKQG